MTMQYQTPEEWIAECKGLTSRDWDNVILFTGDEGVGKSTLMFQVMKALDSTFSAERCHFSIADYLDSVGDLGPDRGIAMDEAELNSRRGMFSDTLDLLDDLQVGRGRNHHIAVCFPHEGRLDRAIRDDRVRWKVYVPQRGLWELYQRVKQKWWNKRTHQMEIRVVWPMVGRFTFDRNSGREWAAYLDKKGEAMRSRRAKRADRGGGGGASGIDEDGATGFLLELRRKYDNGAAPVADVRAQPP